MSSGSGSAKVMVIAMMSNLCIALAKLAGAYFSKSSALLASMLAREIKSLIIGEAPSKNYRPHIESLVRRHIPNSRVLRFLALQTRDGEVMVSFKSPRKYSRRLPVDSDHQSDRRPDPDPVSRGQMAVRGAGFSGLISIKFKHPAKST